MSEALRQVVWKCDRCGGDAQAIFGIFPSCKCGSTSFKAAQPPAPTAQPAESTTGQPLRSICWANCPCRKAAQPVQQPGADVHWCATWLRNNYQDHPSISGLCDAMKEAANQAAPAQRQPLTPSLRRAAEFTRADLGPAGSNYPHVRELLAFAEQALGITAVPEEQK